MFYPGVLPGDLLNVPPGLDFNTDVALPIIGAISADPTGAGIISMLDQTPVPWITPPELVESFITPIGFNFLGVDDLLGRTHGHSFYENMDVYYSGPLPGPGLDAANAFVRRYEDTPDAANFAGRNYVPTGDLQWPVVTLHTDRDPLVPLFHEGMYADIVAAAGNADLLVQRTVIGYGHCAFTVDEMLAAFLELVDWVETGVPAGP